MRHADRLGRFAALYGDQVTIQNPLMMRGLADSLSWNRIIMLGSLGVLWHLKPLIDAGLVAVRNPALVFCEKHLPALVTSGTLEQIGEELERQYSAQLTFTPAEPRGAYSLSGPESLLEHEIAYSFPVKGDGWQAPRRPRAGAAALSKKIRRALVRDLVRPILLDIVHQHVLGADHDVRYLTDRDIDFVALRQASEPGLRDFSRALSEGLSHSIPTLQQLSLKDLVSLRLNEGEVFAVYRDALARVLRDATPADSGRVREAFQDVVRPELNKIDALVANEQKRLGGSAAINLTVGLAAVAVGLFAGLLTGEAGKLLAEAGMVIAGHGAARLAGMPTQPEDKARDNAYYYLWKAREQARLPR